MSYDDNPIIYGNSMRRKFVQRAKTKTIINYAKKDYKPRDYKLSKEERIQIAQENRRRGFTPEKIKKLKMLDRIENQKYKNEKG